MITISSASIHFFSPTSLEADESILAVPVIITVTLATRKGITAAGVVAQIVQWDGRIRFGWCASYLLPIDKHLGIGSLMLVRYITQKYQLNFIPQDLQTWDGHCR